MFCPNFYKAPASAFDADPNLIFLPRVEGFTRRKEAGEKNEKAVDQVNRLWRDSILKRNTALEHIGQSVRLFSGDDKSDYEQRLRRLFATCFPGSRFSLSRDNARPNAFH